MCANFQPVGELQQLRSLFGVNLPSLTVRPEAYPMHEVPLIRGIIVKSNELVPGRECVAARFGLLPRWAKADTINQRRNTHNARIETIDKLASFKGAWRERRYCLIPVNSYYEQCYESGKAVRWRISLVGGLPFALAGIHETWTDGQKVIESFAMITINADGHPLIGRMFAPGEEKRMPVIIRPADYDKWLRATPEEARALCTPYPAGQMEGAPSPRPPRGVAPPVDFSDEG